MTLHDLLTYALYNNEFYNKLYASVGITTSSISNISLENLPIVTKKMLQSAGDTAISKPYFSFPDSNNIYLLRSSASTGEYLKIYWDKKDRTASLFASWIWRSKNFHISPTDKFINFYASRYFGTRFCENIPDISSMNPHYTLLSKLDLSPEKIGKYIDYIQSFLPRWLHIQPSIFLLIWNEMNRRSTAFPDSLCYLEFTGEYISPDAKNYLSNQCKIPIANNYGCNEVNYIACECNCGNMHVLTSNVLVEVLSQNSPALDEEKGDIVITGLYNHAMPIIRYKTGDVGSLIKNHACLCGCKSPILNLSPVRKSYHITTFRGPLSSTELTYIIERVNERMNNCILQYQAHQTSISTMEMHLVLKPQYSSWKQAITNCFYESIPSDVLRSFHWKFYFPKEIYPHKITGKVSYFVNDLPSQ